MCLDVCMYPCVYISKGTGKILFLCKEGHLLNHIHTNKWCRIQQRKMEAVSEGGMSGWNEYNVLELALLTCCHLLLLTWCCYFFCVCARVWFSFFVLFCFIFLWQCLTLTSPAVSVVGTGCTAILSSVLDIRKGSLKWCTFLLHYHLQKMIWIKWITLH